MKSHFCKACSHGWLSRVEKPKCCPRCKRYDWDEPVSSARRKPVEPNAVSAATYPAIKEVSRMLADPPKSPAERTSNRARVKFSRVPRATTDRQMLVDPDKW